MRLLLVHPILGPLDVDARLRGPEQRPADQDQCRRLDAELPVIGVRNWFPVPRSALRHRRVGPARPAGRAIERSCQAIARRTVIRRPLARCACR
jgi:hypothetical protein